MKRYSIVCVDDEKIVLNSLREQLRSIFGTSYSYELAQDAFDALQLIDELVEEDIEIVMVISDYIMPGMYGDEFLILLHQKHPNIKKILLTGQADDQAIHRACEKANLMSCIKKPWSIEELESLVRKGVG